MARFISVVVPNTSGVLSLNERVEATITNPTPVSTGGTPSTSGNYKIHTFNSSGTFTLTAGANVTIEYLIAAAGGGGAAASTAVGGASGAGGGAGGLHTWYPEAINGNDCIGPRFVLKQGDYITITIGGGGASGSTSGGAGGFGGNSSMYIYNSTGTLLNYLLMYGGSGGGQGATYNSSPGGSGGGSRNTTSYVYDIGRMGPPRQGYPGAHGLDGNAGGGGAGGAGSGASAGPGKTDVITGLTYSAGGGMGSGAQSNAAANTGNGGNGTVTKSVLSGQGGSGIVVIRYSYQ